MIRCTHSYEDIICKDNLLSAWREFLIGKRAKLDVQKFEYNLDNNILSLYNDLYLKKYKHGKYHSFYINDPKRRHIHKASVRDRLLHHAVYRKLYPFFDKKFIADSFSCRKNKGTYRAIDRLRSLAFSTSANHRKTCWVLKCDIKKFFASIDHAILLNILREYVVDQDIIWLLNNIIASFCSNYKISHQVRDDKRVGLPLGNLTSQLFANIYMDKFDKWVKNNLKIKYYIRYADDFIILSKSREYLESLILQIEYFLKKELKLELHRDKIIIKTYFSGIDFLGWNNFCDHRVLRKKTEKRMFKKIMANPNNETLQSYLGLLMHGNTLKLQSRMLSEYWLST